MAGPQQQQPPLPLMLISPNNNQSREDILVPLLASRSCHLPGNTWTQDWVQWLQNNHIFFGICLHHRLHPLETWERCLWLASSVSFGLVVTNLHLVYVKNVYLRTLAKEALEYEDTHQDTVFTINDQPVSQGRLVLWTLGGLSHVIFDLTMWHTMACACCHPGGRFGNKPYAKRFKDCGSYALIPVIATLLGLAVYLVLIRAVSESDDNLNNDDNSQTDVPYIPQQLKAFSFLSEYLVEVALAWFVYHPIVGTTLFSGVLGCDGRLPVLGGRPRWVKLVQERLRQDAAANNYQML